MEVAVFRRLQGGRPSYYITLSARLIPDSEKLTITVANPKKWNKHAHIVKDVGKSKIHGSVKIIINKEVVEALALEKSSPVWIRVTPYTEKPAPVPKEPYIARPVKIHTDKSSLFFVISRTQIEYLNMVKPGENLHVYVYINGKVIDYIKRPIKVKGEGLYKILLPRVLFEGLVQPHDTVFVKIKTTNEEEEFFYT